MNKHIMNNLRNKNKMNRPHQHNRKILSQKNLKYSSNSNSSNNIMIMMNFKIVKMNKNNQTNLKIQPLNLTLQLKPKNLKMKLYKLPHSMKMLTLKHNPYIWSTSKSVAPNSFVDNRQPYDKECPPPIYLTTEELLKELPTSKGDIFKSIGMEETP